MKLRVRDKSCKSNPIKMIDKKKKFFKFKCYIALSVTLNLVAAGYIYFNNLH